MSWPALPGILLSQQGTTLLWIINHAVQGALEFKSCWKQPPEVADTQKGTWGVCTSQKGDWPVEQVGPSHIALKVQAVPQHHYPLLQ